MKNINWSKIGWRALQGAVIAILNTPLWVWLIGIFIPYDVAIGQNGNEYIITWIEYLRESDTIEWYHLPILLLFCIIGVLLTIGFVKFLYAQKKEEERMSKQTKELKEAIKGEKENEKLNKDINKYL